MLVQSSLNTMPSNGCMHTQLLVQPLIEKALEDYIIYDMKNNFIDCKNCAAKICANLRLKNSGQLHLKRFKRNNPDSDEYSDVEEEDVTESADVGPSSCPTQSVAPEGGDDVITICDEVVAQTGRGNSQASPFQDSTCSKSQSFDHLYLRINEINSVQIGSAQTNEKTFIELRSWTRKTLTQSGTHRSLQGYKLVTIRWGHKHYYIFGFCLAS